MIFSHTVLCVFGEIGERLWKRLWSEITFMCLRNKQVSYRHCHVEISPIILKFNELSCKKQEEGSLRVVSNDKDSYNMYADSRNNNRQFP